MTGSPSAVLSKLKSLPSDLDTVAEQWQKAWADAMAFWVKAGKPCDDVGLRRH
jgi:hypothetical protein